MAIKVNGTTVIDDSRNFTNINSGFKTVNGTSVVGSGNISAGASTTANDVGTYTWGRPANATNYNTGDTASSVYPIGNTSSTNAPRYLYGSYWSDADVGTVRSGTWRCMSEAYEGGNQAFPTLWVRIS